MKYFLLIILLLSALVNNLEVMANKTKGNLSADDANTKRRQRYAQKKQSKELEKQSKEVQKKLSRIADGRMQRSRKKKQKENARVEAQRT